MGEVQRHTATAVFRPRRCVALRTLRNHRAGALHVTLSEATGLGMEGAVHLPRMTECAALVPRGRARKAQSGSSTLAASLLVGCDATTPGTPRRESRARRTPSSGGRSGQHCVPGVRTGIYGARAGSQRSRVRRSTGARQHRRNTSWLACSNGRTASDNSYGQRDLRGLLIDGLPGNRGARGRVGQL